MTNLPPANRSSQSRLGYQRWTPLGHPLPLAPIPTSRSELAGFIRGQLLRLAITDLEADIVLAPIMQLVDEYVSSGEVGNQK